MLLEVEGDDEDVAEVAKLPIPGRIAAAMAVGPFAYGVSLSLFIYDMRHLGTARAGAYFFGRTVLRAMLAVTLGTGHRAALGSAALMGVGVWLHLPERTTTRTGTSR